MFIKIRNLFIIQIVHIMILNIVQSACIEKFTFPRFKGACAFLNLMNSCKIDRSDSFVRRYDPARNTGFIISETDSQSDTNGETTAVSQRRMYIDTYKWTYHLMDFCVSRSTGISTPRIKADSSILCS